MYLEYALYLNVRYYKGGNIVGKKLNYIRFPRHLIGVIFSITLIMTSFSLYIPEKVFRVAVYIPQLIIFFNLIYLLSLYIRKLYLPKYAAKMLLILFIFLVGYYIIITGYRVIFDGNFTQSLSTAFVIFSSVVLFFLIDADIIEKEVASSDLIIILTLINFMQTIIGITTNSIRQSTLLLNIMVYSSVMLSMIPFLIYIIENRELLKNRKYLSILSWINLFLILIFILASGSRSGFIMLIIILILSMIINYNKRTKFLVKFGIFYLIVSSAIFVLFAFNIFDIKSQLMRASYLNNIIEQQAEIPVVGVPVEELTELPEEDSIKIDIIGSDSVRSYLWETSIKEIKKNPLFGTGTFLFEVEYGGVKLLQGSHNIILESSLLFGIIGMMIFLSMFATPVVFIVMFCIQSRSKTLTRELLNYLVSVGGIFIMAMTQPILVMSFPLLLLWLINGIMYKRSIDYFKDK